MYTHAEEGCGNGPLSEQKSKFADYDAMKSAVFGRCRLDVAYERF